MSKLKPAWLLSIFVLINLLLYFFIFLFNSKIPFNKYNYSYNSYHYLPDSRVAKDDFNLLNALGQYDAQFYLEIANNRYPKNPKTQTQASTYAFFPLFALAISGLNSIIKNIEISAFLTSNIILILDFLSLYFVIGKIFSPSLASKTIFLIFLFPFSIFFRSYYAEGLFLFFLTWFSYFLIKKNWFLTAFFLGLASVTKGNALGLFPVFVYFLYREKSANKIFILTVALTPFVIWIIYNFFQTGNPWYFLTVRSNWVNIPLVLIFANNIFTVFSFFLLKLHSFHSSKIDVLMIIICLYLLFKSKKSLPQKLWLISFSLFLFPLLITDTMSFSRFQTVSFPLFIYIAQSIKSWKYGLLLSFFAIFLFVVSLYFVNWYWVG